MYQESLEDRMERLKSTTQADMGPCSLPSKEEVG
jgi:hypothetical protein